LLPWLLFALAAFVFFGLAVYHFRRLGRGDVDPERASELAKHEFSEPKSVGDWPQWRGPNRDGASTETGLLTEWPKDGPPIMWQAKTGEGFASVVVAAGRAYTIFQDGRRETVACWDAVTGKEIWRFGYEVRYKNSYGYKNDYGNGPRSTPSVDGDRIFAVGATGIMHCLDSANGKKVWSRDLLAEFNAKIPEWGVAFSPLVFGERVFIMAGGPSGQGIAALDKNTGVTLWQQHDDGASYSSPVAAKFHNHQQILFLTGGRLISVVPDTGDLLWSYPWPVQQQINVATPIVMDDYVFISTGYNRGCALLKIEKDAQAWQARLVYKNRNMRNHFSSSVRHKDHVYGFDDNDLKCLNLRNGEIAWEEDGFDKGSVLLVGDQLVVYGANGILALAEATPKAYVEKSRFQFSAQSSRCWSVPVVANGLLYVRDQEKLVCFDVRAKQ
jgi:outer membrane protein assembly factor BamB